MFELKRLSHDAIPAALEKATRYRLLNEPEEAESICLDILEIDPDNQHAKVTLILSLTDQIALGETHLLDRATELAHQLHSEYERHYYGGIIRERRAIAWLRSHERDRDMAAHEWFRKAMQCYERAEPLRPSDTDDPMLRWNSCARRMMDHPDEALQETVAADLGE
jgi:hypothetical protein